MNDRKPCCKRKVKELPCEKLVEILCRIYPVETASELLDVIHRRKKRDKNDG